MDRIEHPAVSLLVPIYNVERYLAECLDSALGQSLRDIEIICINDGSTDSSRKIIERYLQADSRVRVIDKPNSGYGASMNQGLDAARGEYVGILESDDFFEPDALERLLDAARTYDAQVAKADFWFYWSVPQERNERFGWTEGMPEGLTSPKQNLDLFYRKPSIWSALYRRSFLDGNGIRFLETPGAAYQDAAFNFKVWACADRVAVVDRAVLHYRQDNETSSVNSPGKVYCVCDEYREMHRFVSQMPDGQDKVRLRAILSRMRYDTYIWNYERLSEPLQREFVLRMAKDFREDDILAWQRYNGLTFLRCACRFSESAAYDAGASKRKETKELIRSLRAVNPNVEINLFASLHKVNLDTLPGYKTNGEMHSFLERL